MHTFLQITTVTTYHASSKQFIIQSKKHIISDQSHSHTHTHTCRYNTWYMTFICWKRNDAGTRKWKEEERTTKEKMDG